MTNSQNKHAHNTSRPKAGVLIVNLGTPSALDYWSIRKYLKQFLSDPRVVEMNRFKWWLILNGVLLNFIPQRSAKGYRQIWDKKQNRSPLLINTELQAKKLAAKFKEQNILVDFAMRYGDPSIESKLEKLKEQGCTNILILPLYPQYSGSTTASVCDAAFDALKKMRWMPAVRIARPYYDHPSYIEALAKSVKKHLKSKGDQTPMLVTSYHGIPKRYFTNGDPYPCHCEKTTRLLAEKLGINKDQIKLAYQSRFGREEWLSPHLSEELTKFPAEGVKEVCIIAPGFASDCVETLEELSIRNKEPFMAAGGRDYTVIPCLNDSDEGIKMLETLIKEELQGWV